MTDRRWWWFAGFVVLLCLALGVLQYRWIGELSVAERERMQNNLRVGLQRLSRDFNTELTQAGMAILGRADAPDKSPERENAFYSRYERWKESTAHGALFSRIAIVVPEGETPVLSILQPGAVNFTPAAWPENWDGVRQWIESRLSAAGPGPGGPPGDSRRNSLVVELPRFRAGPDRLEESEWLLLEVNLDYVRKQFLPELLGRHLGSGGGGAGAALDYDIALAWDSEAGGEASSLLFRSDPGFSGPGADASVRLFDLAFEQIMRRFGPFGGGGPRAPSPAMRAEGGPPRGPRPGGFFGFRGAFGPGGGGPPPGFGPGGPERGRWLLSVRHRAGSLEAVVFRARIRNLALIGGLLAMMLAALAALMRFTRREQRLAKLQMDFVAGVSHELRTPLAVIRTAAHNLTGGLVTNPKQIQRYGALIRDESERLTGIVEQVLRFAGAQAGHVIQAREPVSVDPLVDEALAATTRITDEAGCLVERNLEQALPRVLADPVALKHAITNLVINAAKYGFSGGWIGVSARLAKDGEAVEISVADRGTGIAPEDQSHLFDPFYRGKRALEDQIHGTGLGLNLVKRIAQAHGGMVTLKSEPGKGSEFTLRIPIAPAQIAQRDEFANTIG